MTATALNPSAVYTDEFYRSEHCQAAKQSRIAHLRRRVRLANIAYRDPQAQQTLWKACARDILFYVNSFGWLLEPREKEVSAGSKIIPFNTREYQDKGFRALQESAGFEDVAVFKSREVGASWKVLYKGDHDWRFKPNSHIGLVSSDENAVDNPYDPDSLMSKLDFIARHLPYWLHPNFDRVPNGTGFRRITTTHVYENLANRSTIIGYPNTKDAGRGGRKLWWMIDELHFTRSPDDMAFMSATQHNCPSRVAISTLNPERGPNGEFYQMVHNPKRKRRLIEIDWKEDPEKARGLYHSENGKLKILDKRYKFPRDYEFILDGRFRSPYYDNEWHRAPNPQWVKAELDREFDSGAYKQFDDETVNRARLTVCDPTVTGRFAFDLEQFKAEWIPVKGGPWQLWFPPQLNRPPSDRMYVIGIDIAFGTAGTHSSYSALVVLDRLTGEQVAEYRDNHIKPDELAELAKAVGKWFNDALLVPEVNGPGQSFVNRFQEIGGYSNFYTRVLKTRGYREQKREIGWRSDQREKKALLDNLRTAVHRAKTTVKSERVPAEMTEYQYENGKLVHRRSEETDDETGKGDGHADVLIAYACAWEGIRDQPLKPEAPPEAAVPWGSLAWMDRVEKQERARREKAAWR